MKDLKMMIITTYYNNYIRIVYWIEFQVDKYVLKRVLCTSDFQNSSTDVK